LGILKKADSPCTQSNMIETQLCEKTKLTLITWKLRFFVAPLVFLAPNTLEPPSFSIFLQLFSLYRFPFSSGAYLWRRPTKQRRRLWWWWWSVRRHRLWRSWTARENEVTKEETTHKKSEFSCCHCLLDIFMRNTFMCCE